MPTKTDENSKSIRAVKILETAQEIVEREGQRAYREGILDGCDMVSICAAACCLAILRVRSLDEHLATELAGTALRTIIRNLMTHGVEVPQEL